MERGFFSLLPGLPTMQSGLCRGERELREGDWSLVILLRKDNNLGGL